MPPHQFGEGLFKLMVRGLSQQFEIFHECFPLNIKGPNVEIRQKSYLNRASLRKSPIGPSTASDTATSSPSWSCALFMTHGRGPLGNSSNIQWLYDLRKAIQSRLASNWDLVAYDGRLDAATLDPYNALSILAGRLVFGANADWADNCFSEDWTQRWRAGL